MVILISLGSKILRPTHGISRQKSNWPLRSTETKRVKRSKLKLSIKINTNGQTEFQPFVPPLSFCRNLCPKCVLALKFSALITQPSLYVGPLSGGQCRSRFQVMTSCSIDFSINYFIPRSGFAWSFNNHLWFSADVHQRKGCDQTEKVRQRSTKSVLNWFHDRDTLL